MFPWRTRCTHLSWRRLSAWPRILVRWRGLDAVDRGFPSAEVTRRQATSRCQQPGFGIGPPDRVSALNPLLRPLGSNLVRSRKELVRLDWFRYRFFAPAWRSLFPWPLLRIGEAALQCFSFAPHGAQGPPRFLLPYGAHSVAARGKWQHRN